MCFATKCYSPPTFHSVVEVRHALWTHEEARISHIASDWQFVFGYNDASPKGPAAST